MILLVNIVYIFNGLCYLTQYITSNRMPILCYSAEWWIEMCERESTMKSIFPMLFFALLLMANSATAAEPKANSPTRASEPIKCYESAWGNKDNPGLGLNAGQSVTLCSGATDADKVIQCFVKAWAHRDDGGLGLNAGQAVTLCKTNSLP